MIWSNPMWTYPARYRDAHSDAAMTIQNDGHNLRMVIRGVAFSGSTPDLLEPEDTSDGGLATFSLRENCLDACVIDWEMDIPIMDGTKFMTGKLFVYFELGGPNPPKGLADEIVRLTLTLEDKQYSSSGSSGWFEDEMLELQRKLPQGVYIKACINCLYSDYSPFGHGVFGDMMCYRNKKEQYLKVRTKGDFFQLGAAAEDVQETFLCPEFERRIPGTGYRG
jgi:hypothetical protein